MTRSEGSRSRSNSEEQKSDRSLSPSSAKHRSSSISVGKKRHSPMSPVRGRLSREKSRSFSRSRTRSPLKRYRKNFSRSRSRSYDRRRSYSRSPVSQRRRHVGTREHPKESRCLGVFGLSMYTTEQKIHQLFSRFGPIERVQVVIDAKTGKSRGFCFVYFEHLEDAKAAKKELCGIELDERRIRVDYSITKRAHTPTPGVYMGKNLRLYRDREYHDRYREDHYREKYRHRDYREYKERSPSPYYRERKRRYEHSRSRSYSPRDRRYR